MFSTVTREYWVTSKLQQLQRAKVYTRYIPWCSLNRFTPISLSTEIWGASEPSKCYWKAPTGRFFFLKREFWQHSDATQSMDSISAVLKTFRVSMKDHASPAYRCLNNIRMVIKTFCWMLRFLSQNAFTFCSRSVQELKNKLGFEKKILITNIQLSANTYSLFIGKSFLNSIASRNVKVAQLNNISMHIHQCTSIQDQQNLATTQ